MSKNSIATLVVIACVVVIMVITGSSLYNSGHFFVVYLTIAGIIAGLVNYFYVYLHLPADASSSGDGKQRGLMNAQTVVWEYPVRSYWLAFSGYIVIGLAGAYLTPVMSAIVGGLKGDINSNHWVLLGYGIVFGFGTNRMLSNILSSVLAKIGTQGATPSIKPGAQTLAVAHLTTPATPTLQRMRAANIPGDFSELVNVPKMDDNFTKGIDISHYNGNINDWQALKNKGISFVYIKTSDGVGTPDNMAQTYALLAHQNGMKIGYYHFGRPDTKNGGTVAADARAEANEFVNLLKNLPNYDLPLMLDLEDVQSPAWDSPLEPADYLVWVDTFMVELFSLTIRNDQLIYSRKNYLDDKLPDDHDLGRFGLWLSRYTTDYNAAIPVKGWKDWKIWQFTGDGANIGANPNPFDLDLMRNA